MVRFRHILFPVDFSDRCYATRACVKALVEHFQSKLTLMHIIQTPTGWYGGMEAAYPVMFDWPGMKEEAEQHLEMFSEPLHVPAIEKVVGHGDPAAHITEYAENNPVDLIMMPTHGYGKFRGLLVGSVTAKVLHDARCAVWTAAHTEEAGFSGDAIYRRIMCAVDVKPENVHLIRYAADVADEYKAKLRLVHAVHVADAGPAKYLDAEFTQFLLQADREAIAELQAEAGTNLELCQETGRVSAVVRAAALHHEADLVIMGRGRMPEAFGRLRTNSYSIVRDSPCPVLSV